MASSNEAVLLKSTLEVHGKSYSVKLTSSEIYWELITSARAAGGPYSEPLVSSTANLVQTCPPEVGLYLEGTVQVFRGTPPAAVSTKHAQDSVAVQKPNAFSCCLPLCKKTENQSVKLEDIVAIRIDTKTPSSGEGKFQHLEMVALSATSFSIHTIRRASKHRWRERKITFHNKDTSIITQWVDKVQEILQKPEYNRPRNLLVFVNPHGGRKKGPKIYHDKVAPLFELAGISTDLIVTQRANHARDIILDYDLSKIDGIVSVGGDGMLSEMIHGLFERMLRDQGIENLPPGSAPPTPSLRLGIIPAGSTDTVAWSVNGTNDQITAALHIILGDKIGIDIATLHHNNQFIRYNLSLLAYGFYGDCIVDSEQNRWMGPKRYDWSGFKKVLKRQVYDGEVLFRPSLDKENNPQDGSNCRAGCQVCQSIPTSKEDSMKDEQTGEWQKIKGRFIGVNSFLMSCKCARSIEGPAPCAHLGDGCLDLVLVQECSRFDYTKHLMRCTDKNKNQFDMPFVQVHRVREFKFRPIIDETEDTQESTDTKPDGVQRLRSRINNNSVWNCDGEVIQEPSLDVRAFRQGVYLFGRGVEDFTAEDSTCIPCATG